LYDANVSREVGRSPESKGTVEGGRLADMRAWWVHQPGPVSAEPGPLQFGERPEPHAGPGQVRVRVTVCGVCRTDLHLAEGDLAPKHPDVTPGHEIVGIVDELGAGAHNYAAGQRVGIAWLRHTCGTCRFCTTDRENLCLAPRFTGWDDDGGYADYAIADERFVYPLPDSIDDEHVAPLLCAGIIGFRALKLANLPPNGRLGVYGFGASAHITAQIAMLQGATVHVLTRAEEARRLALQLGAASARDAYDAPPEPLDSAILFAPIGDLVPAALAALDRGGTLSIAGIHLSDVPALNYQQHLFQERVVRSVTANTRADGHELLAFAASHPLVIATQPYALGDADQALRDLAADRVTGAAVLRI
jgi:propanol-preferring alcohol dehydrogenase